MLNLDDLIALRRIVDHGREDLDPLTTHQNELHRDLAHIGHTSSVNNRIELRHEGQYQVTVLNTVAGNPRTTSRSTLTMKAEQLVWLHIILGEGPLQRLAFLLRQIREQIGRCFYRKGVSIDGRDFELFTIAVRICSVSHKIKAGIVTHTQTASTFRGDHILCIVQYFVAQEHGRHVVEFEGVQ